MPCNGCIPFLIWFDLIFNPLYLICVKFLSYSFIRCSHGHTHARTHQFICFACFLNCNLRCVSHDSQLRLMPSLFYSVMALTMVFMAFWLGNKITGFPNARWYWIAALFASVHTVHTVHCVCALNYCMLDILKQQQMKSGHRVFSQPQDARF